MTYRYCKTAPAMATTPEEIDRRRDAIRGSRNLLIALLTKHGVAQPGRRSDA